MTILELLQKSTEHLKSKDFDNPKTSCEILLAHALGMKRLDLYLNYDMKVTDEEREKFRKMYKRRLNHEPLQYIIGNTEFMSIPFVVRPGALIPRPETELLVEKIIGICKERWGNDSIRILDIGTGSGNIALSLAHYLPNADVEAIDKSSDALKIAIENRKLNELDGRVKLNEKDILKSDTGEYSGLNVIVSNPPYVSEDQKEVLAPEIINHEPHEAVFAGKDGTIFFEKIAGLSKHWLNDDGVLFFEIGYDIGDKVRGILENMEYNKIEILKDYAGHDRIIVAELKGKS